MRSVIACLLLFACGAKSPPPPPPSCPAGPHVMSEAELADFEKQLCGCEDDDCRAGLFTGDRLMSLDQVKSLAKACDRATTPLRDLEQMKHDACACKDSTCASTVEAAFEDWSKRNADTKGTREEAERAGKIISDISDCLMKASQPPPAPAAPH